MINKLKTQCFSSFPYIIKEIKMLEPHHIGKLFDYTQKSKYGEVKESYVGEKLCGEACYVLKHILNQYNYDVKVWYNTRRYGKEIDDHCFIVVNNKIIVDPTYRQFIKSNMIYSQDSIEYLYNKLDPFFIGTNEMLHEILSNKYIYNKSITKYWDREQDITYKFK